MKRCSSKLFRIPKFNKIPLHDRIDHSHTSVIAIVSRRSYSYTKWFSSVEGGRGGGVYSKNNKSSISQEGVNADEDGSTGHLPSASGERENDGHPGEEQPISSTIARGVSQTAEDHPHHPASKEEEREDEEGRVAKGRRKASSEDLIHTVKQKVFSIHPVIQQDELFLPSLGCFVSLLLFLYWMDRSYKRTKRMCEWNQRSLTQQLKELQSEMDSIETKWQKDMVQRDVNLRKVQIASAQLSRSIDRLTAELRNCNPNSRHL